MVLKIRRFVPVFVLLFLTVFATAAFSTNHTMNTALKGLSSNLKHDSADPVPLGDPVTGGGTPSSDGTNGTA